MLEGSIGKMFEFACRRTTGRMENYSTGRRTKTLPTCRVFNKTRRHEVKKRFFLIAVSASHNKRGFIRWLNASQGRAQTLLAGTVLEVTRDYRGVTGC